ncbi:MAG: hypothetical protein AAF393_17765 [Pseudomonadota bacterium]
MLFALGACNIGEDAPQSKFATCMSGEEVDPIGRQMSAVIEERNRINRPWAVAVPPLQPDIKSLTAKDTLILVLGDGGRTDDAFCGAA